MKSEMQIMTAQLGSTVATDESPRSDKGRRAEERSSVFVFGACAPVISGFLLLLRKTEQRAHFPRKLRDMREYT